MASPPQQQDVDAAVRRAVVPERQRDAAGGMAGVPGLEPGPNAPLEVDDHALGDACVRSARGVAVEVFIVCLLSLAVTSRKERAVPAARSPVRGNGNTG